MLSGIEYLYLFTPAVTGFGTSALCKMDETSGESVDFRPPGWVFGVVWPVLYLLIGISWIYASRKSNINNWFYILLTALLMSWIIVYSCRNNKKGAVYILLGSIIVSLLCFSVGDKISKLCISPLIGWLLFAMIMNTTEVQKM